VSGAGIIVTYVDAPVREAMTRLKAFPGPRQGAMLNAIGAYGENSTRLRYRLQAGPDGVPWKPSQRALKTNGRTLTKTGRMRNSVTHNVLANNAGVEWGSNVDYYAPNQFGAVIHRAPHEQSIFQRLSRDGSVGTRFVKKRHATIERRVHVDETTIVIPARPTLGLNAEDDVQIVKIAERHEQAAVLGTSAGGA
jgi:phage gpG-like protein